MSPATETYETTNDVQGIYYGSKFRNYENCKLVEMDASKKIMIQVLKITFRGFIAVHNLVL
jgi:hypothetical protein